jgi:hypothetical protein
MTLDEALARLAVIEAELDASRHEVRFFKEREGYIANLLQVADGGQYRADWRAPIERLVARCAVLEAVVAALPKCDAAGCQEPATYIDRMGLWWCDEAVQAVLDQGHQPGYDAGGFRELPYAAALRALEMSSG